MYCVKRVEWKTEGVECKKHVSYYKYDGWQSFSNGEPLDLTGVVLFTKQERRVNFLGPNEEWQWYGSYKR